MYYKADVETWDSVVYTESPDVYTYNIVIYTINLQQKTFERSDITEGQNMKLNVFLIINDISRKHKRQKDFFKPLAQNILILISTFSILFD